MNADEGEITVSEMPETPLVLGGPADLDDCEGFAGDYMTFCTTPRNPALNLSFPVGGYFKDMDTFLRHPSKPTCCFSLDPNGRERKEKGLYLVGYTRGCYGQTNDLPQRMAAYAKVNDLAFDGPVYNIYLIDESPYHHFKWWYVRSAPYKGAYCVQRLKAWFRKHLMLRPPLKGH